MQNGFDAEMFLNRRYALWINVSETLEKLENKDNRMQTLNSLAIIKTSNVNQN